MNIDVNHLKIRVFAFDKKTVGDWWNFKNHISPFARIFLIKGGEQTVSFGGHDFRQSKNSIALVPPFTPVDYVCEDWCEQYYLIFSCHLPNGKDLFADYRFPYLLESEEWQHTICEQLLEILPNFGLENVDADSHDFNELIFETNKTEVSLQQKLAAQGATALLLSPFAVGAKECFSLIRFAKAFQYIENNLASDLSLTVLAEIEGMSRTYFSDQFELHTGVRPTNYIAQKRENRARELLTTTKLSLVEIAEQVGFTDTGYFSRFFKKRTGYTPRGYRNK